MKHFIRFSAILALVFFSSCVPPQQEPAAEEDSSLENAPASYQEFYDGLSPYGHWIQGPSGEYVWVPEAGPDFTPYSTNGSWVWTDAYGWAWTSDYPWGWAAFHYGRWDYNDGYGGWYWAPDLTWGPAWVAWRHCPGYYGWAPLRPGFSVDIAFGDGYRPGERFWTVCDEGFMGRREMRDHYEHGGEHFGRITGGESHSVGAAPNVGGGRRGFVTGPAREQVEAVTHTPVQAVKIVQSNKPGEAVSGNTWSVYRPQVQRLSGSQAQSASHSSTPQTQSAQRIAPVQTQPAQRTSPTQTQPAPRSVPTQTQAAPRSVTTPADIQYLHQQAQQSRGAAPPQNYRQSTPAPRQQYTPRQAPMQSAPRQSAPRSNPPSGGGGRVGGGRPK